MSMTARQRAFVEAYAGNATEAAIVAGYSRKTARSIGQNLLTKVDIQKAIQERETKRADGLVATREDRLIFLTRVMRDETLPTKDRLRAIELLGRAEGDFLVRVEAKAEVITPASILEAVRRRRREAREIA